MTRTPLLITLALAAALAGCSKENHTIVAGPDGDETNQTNSTANKAVALPPSIQSSKSYRCADNTIVYVDWMSDGTALVKKKQAEVGAPIAAGSPDLKGDPTSSSITYKGQSCKA
jgi:hypothetical protein